MIAVGSSLSGTIFQGCLLGVTTTGLRSLGAPSMEMYCPLTFLILCKLFPASSKIHYGTSRYTVNVFRIPVVQTGCFECVERTCWFHSPWRPQLSRDLEQRCNFWATKSQRADVLILTEGTRVRFMHRETVDGSSVPLNYSGCNPQLCSYPC